MKKTRIGIDIHVIEGMHQGTRTYVIELFSRVIPLLPDFEFYLFTFNPDDVAKNFPGLSGPNVRFVKLKYKNPLLRLCWELPKAILKCDIDYFHSQYILPIPCFAKGVVTIHDILFESHPQFFTKFTILRSKILYRLSSMIASKIVVVSNFTKNELVNKYGIDPEKISVIYNAVDHRKFFPGRDEARIFDDLELESGNYFITVGRIEPRKNHKNLIEAYSALSSESPKLVIVGNYDFGVDNLLEQADRLGIRNKIIHLTSISDDDLPILYRNALALIYPSFAEGFGLPLLEGMASGIPVATSNTSALAEIVDDCGILFNPYCINGITNVLNSIINSSLLKNDLIKRGMSRSSIFKWEHAAESLAQIYRSDLDLKN